MIERNGYFQSTNHRGPSESSDQDPSQGILKLFALDWFVQNPEISYNSTLKNQ